MKENHIVYCIIGIAVFISLISMFYLKNNAVITVNTFNRHFIHENISDMKYDSYDIVLTESGKDIILHFERKD